jgi:hypothetical protein
MLKPSDCVTQCTMASHYRRAEAGHWDKFSFVKVVAVVDPTKVFRRYPKR